MADSQVLKGWRTLGVSVGVATLGAVQTYLLSGGGVGLIPLPYIGPLLLAIGFGMAFLRSQTTTSIGNNTVEEVAAVKAVDKAAAVAAKK